MSNTDILTLFLLGFFGGTHCVGMCGGLSSAFALQLPKHIPRLLLIFLMNLGRISSYVLIGGLLGAISQLGFLLDYTHTLQTGLYVLAHILLLFMGLYLAGLLTWAAQIERIGKPIWRMLNPVLNRLLPIHSPMTCFLIGMLWGWLPCGLVYNAALYALGSGSAMQGAMLLLAFGLGTLPNMLAMGAFATQLQGVMRHRGVRLVAGLFISVWAMVCIINTLI